MVPVKWRAPVLISGSRAVSKRVRHGERTLRPHRPSTRFAPRGRDWRARWRAGRGPDQDAQPARPRQRREKVRPGQETLRQALYHEAQMLHERQLPVKGGRQGLPERYLPLPTTVTRLRRGVLPGGEAVHRPGVLARRRGSRLHLPAQQLSHRQWPTGAPPPAPTRNRRRVALAGPGQEREAQSHRVRRLKSRWTNHPRRVRVFRVGRERLPWWRCGNGRLQRVETEQWPQCKHAQHQVHRGWDRPRPGQRWAMVLDDHFRHATPVVGRDDSRRQGHPPPGSIVSSRGDRQRQRCAKTGTITTPSECLQPERENVVTSLPHWQWYGSFLAYLSQ